MPRGFLVDSQVTLDGLSFGDKQAIIRIEGEIQEIKLDLAFIESAQSDTHLIFEVVLDIERYLGRRSPWYLDLTNNVEDEYEGCPRVSDYEIGYYGHDNAPGTHKFIMDRLNWAKKLLLNNLEEAEANLRDLEAPMW